MGQKINKGGRKSTSVEVMSGAFLYQATIVDVEDKSSYPGKEEFHFKSGKKTSLYLVVNVNKGGGDTQKLHLFAWFSKGKDGQVTGWVEFPNAVSSFITAALNLQMLELESDHTIPREVWHKLEGSEFQFIKYFTQKTYTGDDGEEVNSWELYNKFYAKGDSIDYIQEDFCNDKNIEWLKENKLFDPEGFLVWKENVEKEEKKIDEKLDKPVDDDDLPF